MRTLNTNILLIFPRTERFEITNQTYKPQIKIRENYTTKVNVMRRNIRYMKHVSIEIWPFVIRLFRYLREIIREKYALYYNIKIKI